ncbi:MAG: protein O-mannosyl-transferase family [Vulcanimicrobiaceae bacterium]
MNRTYSRIAGWLAWLVPFGVYAASLNRAVAYWDTGEMQVVPWILGIAHPTGFPVFTIFGWIFTHVVAIGPVSMRMSLFCALAMSLTAWLVYRTLAELVDAPWVAMASAWLFAFGDVAWTRGTRAEVHALAVFFAVLTFYCAVRWYRTARSTALVGGALAWGLGIATHPIVALLLPALLVLFFARLRAVRARALVLAALALLAGVSFYAYLPLRSAYVDRARLDPTLQLGEAPGKPFWDDDDPSTWRGFVTLVTGSQFHAGASVASIVSPQTYVRRGPEYLETLAAEYTPLGVLLALVGLGMLLVRDRLLGIAALLAAWVPTAFAFGYTVEADRDRYYLTSFAIVALAAGYAVAELLRRRPAWRGAAAVALAAMALGQLFVHRDIFGQWNSSGAESVIRTVRQRTPPNAILIAPWIYATPLAYAAYVDRSLGNRIVETAWLEDDASRVPVWAKTRPVYVVGILFGSVRGYYPQPVGGDPTLYRMVKD